MILVAAAVWAAFTTLDLVSRRPLGAGVNLAACAACLLALAGDRGPTGHRRAAHATIASSVVGLIVSSWLSGGGDAIAWWFLAAVPPFALHALDRRDAAVWSAIAVAAVPIAVGNPFGVPTEAVPRPLDRVAGGIALISVTAAFASLARSASESRLASASQAARTRVAAVSGLTHELRTPLHGILGSALVLAESPLDAGQRGLIEGLRANGAGLLRMVNDLLDVARIEAGHVDLEIEPTDLLAVLEDVVDAHALAAAQRGLSLLLVPVKMHECLLMADGQRIRQIVSNLVDNAIKFTDQGGVTITASCTQLATRAVVRVCVEDTGPGIPAERHGSLFSPFASGVEEERRRRGGTGLGLWLSRELAVRMEGDLGFTPAAPTGARFELTLSLRPTYSTTPEPGDKVWLVVEPDAASATATRGALRSALVPHEVVGDVDSALRVLERGPADVVLIAAGASLDPGGALAALEPRLGGARAVLAVPVTELARATERFPRFHTATPRNLRRSRIHEIVAAARPTPRTEVGRAIVVDDDQVSRTILATLLQRRALDVRVFDDARDALALIAEGVAPDCVFSDLNMRPVDGLEFARRVRAIDASVRLVAVTASTPADEEERCRAAGFDAVVGKPFDTAAIEREILGRPDRDVATAGLIDEARWAQAAQLLGRELDQTLGDHARAARASIRAILEHAGNADGVRQAAHALAGSSALIGYRALFLAARALESRARGPVDVEGVRSAAHHLLMLLDRSIEQLDLLRGNVTVPPGDERVASPPAGESPSPGDPPPSPGDGPAGTSPLVMRTPEGPVQGDQVKTHLADLLAGAPPGALDLVLDARRATRSDPEASWAFWSFLRDHKARIRRVAVVSDQPIWIPFVRGRAAWFGVRARGFTSMRAAHEWLRVEAEASAASARPPPGSTGR